MKHDIEELIAAEDAAQEEFEAAQEKLQKATQRLAHARRELKREAAEIKEMETRERNENIFDAWMKREGTLKQIGERFGLSGQRVSMIAAQYLRKWRHPSGREKHSFLERYTDEEIQKRIGQ